MALNWYTGDVDDREDRSVVSPQRLVRVLGRRYVLVLAAVALLILVDQAVLQPLLVRLDTYAPVINVAGRQRMLSQRLTKAALAMSRLPAGEERDARRAELSETLRQWSASHTALRNGDSARGLARIDTPEIQATWLDLEPHHQELRGAALALLTCDPGDESSHVNVILAHEPRFLAAMERNVALMEHEAGLEVRRLRACASAIAATVIALLLGLGWFVLRPATRTIRRQVDELDARVRLRTAELAAANASLQREVQERTRAEANTQRLAAQLAHASRVSSLGHLAAGLAHEINQPLAAIVNYVETCDTLLARQELDQGRLVSHFGAIRAAALRAGQIVHRIRNFVGLRPAAASRMDLNELLREVVEFCRSDIEAKQVQSRLRTPRMPTEVLADRIELQQVLVNLVQNAIQAFDVPSSSDRRMLLALTVVGGEAQVEVTDNGPGFADADPESLFDPFHTTKADGLGIGLSICRSIIERHGGSIHAAPAEGGGAAFRFTLPLVDSTHDVSQRLPADCICRG